MVYSAKHDNTTISATVGSTTTTMTFGQCAASEQTLLRTATQIGFGSMWNIWITDGVILPGMFRTRMGRKLDQREPYRQRRLENNTVLRMQQVNCLSFIWDVDFGMVTVTVQDGLPDFWTVDQERAIA